MSGGCDMVGGSMGGGGVAPATTPPPSGSTGIEAVLTQLVSAVQQLVGAVQAFGGATAVQGGGAPGATPQQIGQSPEQTAPTPPTPAPPTDVAGAKGTAFNIATFNVLGASHTAAGGNKPQLKSGAERTKGAVATLRKHDVDVAGLQEFQESQQAAFKKLAPGYSMYGNTDNTVVWKSDRFRKVSARTVTIPYFEGHPRKMPVVQLEDKATGKRMWVINVHNPADTKDHPHNAANRAKAVEIERDLIAKLKATGVPVYIVGDFNDSKVESKVERGSLMDASRSKGQRAGIDWVFGSQGVEFTKNTRDDSPKRNGTSDHPIVVAQTRIA